MHVNQEVFLWLTTTTQAIPQSEGRKAEDNNWVLSKLATAQIESGVTFTKILRAISNLKHKQKKQEHVFPELEGLKEMNTPAARVNNWNILCETLKKFNITESPEEKGLLIGADQGQIMNLISDLMNLTSDIVNNKQSKKRVQEYKEETDVTKLDVNKHPTQCKSCLELLLVLLSKHLSLPPIQAASLFTHNSKYFAHLLAKGVKGLFEPVISFFQELYANIPTLISLFKDDTTKKNMTFTLNSLKAGMVSKNIEVAQWTARLLSKLAFEFGDNQLLGVGWEWFVGESNGLGVTLLGLKRHPDLKDLVVQVLLQFARYNFIELFTQYLKRSQPEPKDLIGTYLAILKPLTLSNSDGSSDEILNSGILDDWIDFAIETASPGEESRNTADGKIVALAFLTEVWMLFPDKIEEIEDRANAIISLFSKASHDKSNALILNSLTLQFQLLIYFGDQKNQYAPNIYRSLTLSMIENSAKMHIREFMMFNFINAYDILESIPFNILIEPLVRQMQLSDNQTYELNIFDYNFFTYISRNERLQLKNGIQLLDLFFKIYLNNHAFASLATIPILNIVNKFIESDTLHEFVIKFVKVSLAMFYASEKKKRPKDKVLPLYNGKSGGANNSSVNNISQQEIEVEIVQAQKRALIVNMIKSVVNLNCNQLNDKIKPLVAHTNIQIKQFSKQNSKGMITILMLFGNYDDILQQYEKEYMDHQEILKQQQQQKQQEDDEDAQSQLRNNENEAIKEMQENLKKYSKLSKEEITHLAYLRNPKADQKVLMNLQQLKTNYENQEQSKIQSAQLQEENIVKEKSQLRKQLEKRNLEQGIASLNQKDIECNILFQFGTREKQLMRENANGIPQIQYIDLDTEEKRDRDMIQILLRKYTKALKNIFVKYSNSGFSSQFSYKNSNTFDSIKDKSSIISVPEIYRFIKDYEFSDYLSKDEHTTLVRIIAIEQQKKKKKLSEYQVPQLDSQELVEQSKPLLLKKKSLEPWQIQRDLMSPQPRPQSKQQNMFEKSQSQRLNLPGEIRETKTFDFQGFQDYIIQFAGYIYSKPPEDLRHLPLSASLQKVLDHLKEVTKLRGQSTLLFEDVENQYFGEADVLKQYNKKLEENPDFVLPQGYKKVKERDLKFDYSLNSKNKIKMKESFQYAFSILNDLFQEKLNFYLLEPKSISKEVYRAVPIIGASPDIQSHYMDHFKTPKQSDKKEKKGLKAINMSADILGPWGKPDSTKTIPTTFGLKPKYGDKRVLEIDTNHKLDLGMKLALSTFSYKDKATAEQVAFCLDDIIKAVEQGKSTIAKKKVENIVIQERKKEEEEEENEKKKQNERLKKGHNFIISRAKEILIENDKKEKEQIEKEVKKKEKEDKVMKKKVEEMDSFWKEKKEELMKVKKQEIEDKKKQEEQVISAQKEIKGKKEKEFQEFIKKQIDKQTDEFKKAKEKEKKQEEENKKKEEIHLTLIKKTHENNIKSNAERVEKQKQINDKIKQLYESEPITQVMKQNENKLNSLFDCLLKMTFRQIASNVIRDDQIDQKTFNWFCHQFSIFPQILSTNEIALIYRSVSKNKLIEDMRPIGINLDEFKQAMLRIAIKGKKTFNQIAESAQKGDKLNQSNMQEIAGKVNNSKEEANKLAEQQKNANDSLKYVIDDYGDIDQANAQTLQMLIHYLGLPNDKVGINEAIKHARESRPRPNVVLKQGMR